MIERDAKQVTTLVRHGQRLALVLDDGMLEALNIQEGTAVEVRRKNGLLLVSSATANVRDEEFETALQQVNAEFGDVLKNLAK